MTSSPQLPTDASRRPDPRVLLANERTFLAWMRTSLAVGAAGLGIAGLAPVTNPEWVRPAIALAVTGLAMSFMVWALQRFRASNAAIWAGEQVPPLRHATWMALGLGVGLLVAVVALLLTT